MNIIRHLRNESAYQLLRNGFVLLLSALFIALFTLTNIEVNQAPQKVTDKPATTLIEGRKQTDKARKKIGLK